MPPLRKWPIPHSIQENNPQWKNGSGIWIQEGGQEGGGSRGRDGRTGRGGEDGERRGAAEKNTREFSLNLSAEKSFLTVTQNQPREKKPWKMRPRNFSVSHREKHYKKAKSKYNWFTRRKFLERISRTKDQIPEPGTNKLLKTDRPKS